MVVILLYTPMIQDIILKLKQIIYYLQNKKRLQAVQQLQAVVLMVTFICNTFKKTKMEIITKTESIVYLSESGDWALRVTNEEKEILPQNGNFSDKSGSNLDNLVQLIIEAKAHAILNGITWQQ